MDCDIHSCGPGNDWIYNCSAFNNVMQKSRENNKKFLAFKIGLMLLLVVAIFIGIALVKETYKKNAIQEEISRLEAEAEKIEKGNLSIQEKIAYFESREYQEKEAKDKLNLQNRGESVIIIRPGISDSYKKEEEIGENTQSIKSENEKNTNYRKWWNYFFK